MAATDIMNHIPFTPVTTLRRAQTRYGGFTSELISRAENSFINDLTLTNTAYHIWRKLLLNCDS